MAALTMPMLIQNYKKQVIVTRLEKFYSTFSNALNMSVSQNGPIEHWDFPAHQGNGDEMQVFMDKYLATYILKLKQCGPHDSCYTNRNRKIPLFSATQSFYILSDGSCFSISKGGGNAETSGGYMHIAYDINCSGGPDKYNVDVFSFIVAFKSSQHFTFKPGDTCTFGSMGNRTRSLECCSKNIVDNTASCGALIQHDGWKIENDYPYKL